MARVHTLLADIDGTMTSGGRLGAAAYRAMEQLQAAGVHVVPVTGRPAGWCDMIARFWPVTAREQDRARLAEIGRQVLRQVPGTAIAADQRYREADLAIDWCEDVPALGHAQVQRVADLLHRHGLTVKVSSIHVNAWFGAYDKLTMTRRLMREQFGIDLDGERDRLAFADAIEHPPAYVVRGAEGAGFAELARLILARRRDRG